MLDDKFWDIIYPEMQDQVSNHIKANRTLTDNYNDYVTFSAWNDEENNNLHDVAITGRVQMIEEIERFFGNIEPTKRKNYISDVLENPTWLDLVLCANDMINTTGDNHHIFLESVYPDESGKFSLDEKSFVKLYKFSMGA